MRNLYLILLTIFFLIGFFSFIKSKPQQKYIPTPITLVKITKVFDGDTFEIETGQHVRYIGLNAPELYYPNRPIECFATEAQKANKDLVEGKMVRLEKDVSETDKYGRLLRYVYLENTSTNIPLFVNKFLITEGYARLMTIPPDLKYYSVFKEEELKAKNKKKGLWHSCYN